MAACSILLLIKWNQTALPRVRTAVDILTDALFNILTSATVLALAIAVGIYRGDASPYHVGLAKKHTDIIAQFVTLSTIWFLYIPKLLPQVLSYPQAVRKPL